MPLFLVWLANDPVILMARPGISLIASIRPMARRAKSRIDG